MNTIEKLQKCIDQMNNMTQEEFDKILKEKGLDNIVYTESDYIDENFKIIFDENEIETDYYVDIPSENKESDKVE